VSQKKSVPQKKSVEARQSKVSGILILVAAVSILLVLVLLYLRSDPQTQTAVSDAGVAQPATPQAEQESAQDTTQTDAKSQESAKQVMVELKRFQESTQSNQSYEEYDAKLTNLKADLNNALPSFVRHDENDERFRQEVAGAIRDYTAAGNWWKTTIRNSSVLTDDDRTTRLQANWASAQTHVDNAEKLLP
jgi:hypothetical protein